MLHIASDNYVLGQLPRLCARTRQALGPDDPRRIELEAIAARSPKAALDHVDREVLGAVFHATNSEARRKQTRVRSFRNVVIVTSLVMWLAVAGFAVLGATRPELVPLCFNPTGKVVCPTEESPAPVPTAGGAPGQPATADPATEADVDKIVAQTVSPWDIFLIEVSASSPRPWRPPRRCATSAARRRPTASRWRSRRSSCRPARSPRSWA